MRSGLKKSALGIFFRIPELGRVKKRLAVEIGDEAALKTYEAMLASVMDRTAKLNAIDIYGFYEGESAKLEELPFTIPVIRQQGIDLGEKMLNAFALLFEKGLFA